MAGGLTVIAIALAHIALGPRAIPGAVPVNATLDSEDRFYATIFLGYGLAMLWAVRAIDRRANIIRFLAALLFAGGLARIVSIVQAGLPHPLFQFLTGVELLLPPLVWWLLRQIARDR